VVNKPVIEDLEDKSLIADHMIIGNGQGWLVTVPMMSAASWLTTDTLTPDKQTPLDSTSYLTKDNNEKNAKYNAVYNRNGHKFVAFVVDRFGTAIEYVQYLMFQMFKRNAKKIVLRSPMLRQI
jgi:hypothetical protein